MSESLTEKFARSIQKRFGDIPGITDKLYITNSFHVNVREPINAFDKIAYEAPFQSISSAGCISYVEIPNLQHNPSAVMEVVQFAYDICRYYEFNTKSDYCMECGYDGEILIDDDLNWYCPNCGNRNKERMSVTRRTCGYLGENYWGKGRTQEIKERVMHL